MNCVRQSIEEMNETDDLISDILKFGHSITLDINNKKCLCSVWNKPDKTGMQEKVIWALKDTPQQALQACLDYLKSTLE